MEERILIVDAVMFDTHSLEKDLRQYSPQHYKFFMNGKLVQTKTVEVVEKEIGFFPITDGLRPNTEQLPTLENHHASSD